ncbi:hypothetical protein BH24ACT3_BH24ACT3_04800 [soil metagenome]
MVTVVNPGDHAGDEADASVTATTGAVLAVHTADCAPVVLVSPAGVVGVVHAGWRGLATGVLDAAVQAMRRRRRRLGAGDVHAVVGPCIGPECYAFGPADLGRVAAELGEAVRGRTSDGDPALDLVAGVRAGLARVGVDRIETVGSCTACTGEWFSHRARGDTGRQATVVWLDRRRVGQR